VVVPAVPVGAEAAQPPSTETGRWWPSPGAAVEAGAEDTA